MARPARACSGDQPGDDRADARDELPVVEGTVIVDLLTQQPGKRIIGVGKKTVERSGRVVGQLRHVAIVPSGAVKDCYL